MKRILLVVVGGVVVVVVALVVFVFTGLGGAIKAIVEGVGSRATGTEVTLASADVSLTSGDGTLKGLVVGNPKGYSTPSAIELGQIHVKLDTSTVTSDTVVIKEILIDGPHLTYEVGPGGSNLGVIQANVAAFGGGASGGGKPAPKPEAPEKGGGTKVVIENLIVKGGKVDVSAAFLAGRAVGAALPEIHLKDIGKSQGGATSGEVAARLLDELTKGALKAVADLGIEGLEKKAEGAIGKAVKDLLGGKKK